MLYPTIFRLLGVGCIFTATAAHPAEIRLGEPHSTVQTLNVDTFRPALNDPVNRLWLLKFGAAWDAWSRPLEKTLDTIAPDLVGKIAIGKVDCSAPDGKEICEELKVVNYPTIIVYHDGDFFKYPSWRRDADSMIEFAERMSKPAVKIVNSYDEFMRDILVDKKEEDKDCPGCILPPGSTGVAFLVFDVNAKEIYNSDCSSEEVITMEKCMVSSTALKVFGQASRKMQDRAVFGMLHPSNGSELKNFGIAVGDNTGEQYGNDPGPLLVKIEENNDPVIYKGPLTTVDFMAFVTAYNTYGGDAGIVESLHGFISRNFQLSQRNQVQNFLLIRSMKKNRHTLIGVVVVFCGILYALYQSNILKLQLEQTEKGNKKKKTEHED